MFYCQEETLSLFNALLLISLKKYLIKYSSVQESTDFLLRSNNIVSYLVLLTLSAIFSCPPVQTHLFTAVGITTVMSYGIISGSAILSLFNTICMRIVPAFKTEFASGNIVTPVVTEAVIAWHTIRAAVWHQKVWTTVQRDSHDPAWSFATEFLGFLFGWLYIWIYNPSIIQRRGVFVNKVAWSTYNMAAIIIPNLHNHSASL